MQKLTRRDPSPAPNGTKPGPKRPLSRLRARRARGGSMGQPATFRGTPGDAGRGSGSLG